MQINNFFLRVQRTVRQSTTLSGSVPATVVSIYSLAAYQNTKNITDLVENAKPLATGVALLNPRDQMNKRRGLLIAGGRAAKQLGMKFTFTRYNYTDDETGAIEVRGEYELSQADEAVALNNAPKDSKPSPMAEGKNAGYMPVKV